MASATSALIVREPGPLIAVPVFDEPEVGTVTLALLFEHFNYSKRMAMKAGEIAQASYNFYVEAEERMKQFFGPSMLVDDLRPLHFTRFRATFPSTWGPGILSRVIQNTRSIFKFAYDNGLIDRPLRFGQDFRKPKTIIFRRLKREKGSMMFEAAQIRAMLDHALPTLRAMIMLGINCGFGNSDCGRLPFSALDLDGGWVNFPRPKTEVDRRCPLWPETVLAIRRALMLRPRPAREAYKDLVFLTQLGTPWADGNPHPPVMTAMVRLVKRLGMHKSGLKFYGLRRSFETIGGDSLDQVAVDYIMGHVDDTMAGTYRQRVDDSRLLAVSECVRAWLFPDDNVNHFKQYQAKAEAVHKRWEIIPTLTPVDIQVMLKELGIKQYEMARGIGYNAQHVNALVRGRSALSADTEMRIRTFVAQLAGGELPKPTVKGPLSRPQYDCLADVPLSEDARAALFHNPLTCNDLAVLAECLAEVGITQMRLAELWGYTSQFYGKMRYGAKKIPWMGANRLRVLFGLPSASYEVTARPREPGKIPATPAIAEILNRPEFNGSDLREVMAILRKQFGIYSTEVSKWLGMPRSAFYDASRGQYQGRAFKGYGTALRALFTFEGIDAEKAGAE